MPTRVGDVKAADPGLGFTLTFDSPLHSTLRVVITMTDLQQPGNGSYQSEVNILNNISDTELVFVVPFGDNAYAPSNLLNFQVDLYSPYNASTPINPNTPLTGVVMGEKGSFSFSTSVPTSIKRLLQTGDMLQSKDGAFIGVYQTDGNFCIYPQFADNQSKLDAVYSTHTKIDGPTTMVQSMTDVNHFQIAMRDSKGNSLGKCSIDYSVADGLEFTIDSMGRLLCNGAGFDFSRF
ncbi:MAG: hypothetical protein SFV55_09715 [Haliscomenobacter sp.]|uniref:hypothetical protein n=1 Tax=Haliscomenobacter sp. TaxID=2717303 RepID=UPI0029B6374D|nr:hypothetical protein [Haliscomenobacter sp.]MDX2068692.1 hypothetical protein [Haliscomenobacter sp.]